MIIPSFKITEIFYSIQGEGIFAGLPMIFIRFTGCNLRCKWCDTPYSYSGGSDMDLEEIMENIKPYTSNTVFLTGGEPLIQNSINSLVDRLLRENYRVIIETNGSIDISHFSGSEVIISMDIKCPSSGMSKYNKISNLSLLKETDQLKFVVFDRNDMDYAFDILKRNIISAQVVFQPVFGTDIKDMASYFLHECDAYVESVGKKCLHGNHIYNQPRFTIQQHKIIWGDERGV